MRGGGEDRLSLTRLVIAWLAVAAWFVAAAFGLARFFPAARPSWQRVAWRAAEALVVTLLGSLWFDSLGPGGWWLVFLLLGAVVAVAAQPARDASTRDMIVATLADLARYIVAGALLAWRLG